MKGKLSLTIDEEILDSFNSHCEEKHIKRSSLVQEWMEDYLNKLLTEVVKDGEPDSEKSDEGKD
jgi:metal-responsive CopG/Arc/MetJ family transcriptional regulator